jgi:general secretion pathway protein N
MNAAMQRRLTPWLIGALLLSGALLLAVLLGLGRGVRWDAPRALGALPPAHASSALPPPPPLAAFAPVWQQPLFSADRLPTASTAAAAVSLGELELTGVILTPDLHLALLRDKNGDRPLRVAEGATLPDSGWRLVELKPRSAVFASANGRTELTLPVTAPAALSAASRPPGGAPAAGTPAIAPASPPTAMVVPVTTPPPPTSTATDEAAAQQRARLEALKAAMQRRRAANQSQVPSAPDPSSRDH